LNWMGPPVVKTDLAPSPHFRRGRQRRRPSTKWYGCQLCGWQCGMKGRVATGHQGSQMARVFRGTAMGPGNSGGPVSLQNRKWNATEVGPSVVEELLRIFP
jgi:hypothetical protein